MAPDSKETELIVLNPQKLINKEQGQSTTNFTVLKRTYILLVCFSGAVLFYFYYNSSDFYLSLQYQQIFSGKLFQSMFNGTGIKAPGKRRHKITFEMACNIPILKPYDQSILPYYRPPSPADCAAGYPLIFTTDLESNLIQVKDPSKHGYFNCCYQEFRRGKTDKKIEVRPKCFPITKSKTVIPGGVEFIRVNCTVLKNDTYVVVPKDYFGLVRLKPTVEKRIENFWASKKTTKFGNVTPNFESSTAQREEGTHRTLNVVILGLDAMSHMNFLRTMPMTHEFLIKNLSAIAMNGFVKVGDNTFPNMVPALTGQSVKPPENACWQGKTFDDCPLIWKEYASQGYRTALGEDAIWMSTFNYNKKGFRKIPTDYYNLHLAYQLEKFVGHHQLMLTPLCYSSVMAIEVSLDYLKKMAFTMNKTRRYFQFNWVTSLSHDYLNTPKLGDKPILKTLTWFKNQGYLEDTAFVLMSDHGLRWGYQRSTLQGRLEERMPFLYFILPEWFKDEYRPAVSNMIRNRRRLTTHFDAHETLKDLANLKTISQPRIRQRYKELAKRKNLPRGISLFLPVPTRRTCEDATIPEHYCVCRGMKEVNIENNTLVTEAARSVVHYINGMFISFPQCTNLRLHQVFQAQVFQASSGKVMDGSVNITRSDDPLLAKQQVTFSVTFSVLPSNATFEGTTTRFTDGTWHVSGEVSRTNMYGDQSICVTDYDLKKFCYCY